MLPTERAWLTLLSPCPTLPSSSPTSGRTIDLGVCEVQPGDDPATPFSFMHMQRPGWRPEARQVACHGTRTSAASEALVLECMASGV